MPSKNPSDLPNLDRDIPTTPEDIRALRENRPLARADWFEQLQSLADQFPATEEMMRKRPTFEGYEPFKL